MDGLTPRLEPLLSCQVSSGLRRPATRRAHRLAPGDRANALLTTAVEEWDKPRIPWGGHALYGLVRRPGRDWPGPSNPAENPKVCREMFEKRYDLGLFRILSITSAPVVITGRSSCR